MSEKRYDEQYKREAVKLVTEQGLTKAEAGSLLVAAAYLVRPLRTQMGEASRPVPVAVPCGAGIGLLSGLTGVGGGIFLSPLLLLAGWLDPRPAAGVAAGFVLVNSLAGLAGHFSSAATLPQGLLLWAPAALEGDWSAQRWPANISVA